VLARPDRPGTMIIRRALALVASGLLLHLNMLGVERACGPRHGAATGTTEHAGHLGHSQPPAPTPAQSQGKCCDALSACSMSFELGAERGIRAAESAATPVVTPGNAQRSAPRRAPDPPPPRA
jgi:hypothetical protein